MKIVLKLVCLFFVLSTSFLIALDKNEFKKFSQEYANREKSSWSEFIYAVEIGYDDIALFYAKGYPNLNFTYESHVDVNNPKKIIYKNALNTILKSGNIYLLSKILDIHPQEAMAFNYSKVIACFCGKQPIDHFEEKYALNIAIDELENSIEIVKLLVEHGADVNFSSFEHYYSWNVNTAYRRDITPLQAASEKEKFDVIEYLIINGANVENAYHTLDLCIVKNRLDIADLLIEFGCNGKTHSNGLNGNLNTAIVCNNINAVVLLLNNGVKPRAADVSNALERGFNEIADLLTEVILQQK